MYQCQFQCLGFPRDRCSDMPLDHRRKSARKDDVATESCESRWWRIREQRNPLDEFWDRHGCLEHELHPCEDE